MYTAALNTTNSLAYLPKTIIAIPYPTKNVLEHVASGLDINKAAYGFLQEVNLTLSSTVPAGPEAYPPLSGFSSFPTQPPYTKGKD